MKRRFAYILALALVVTAFGLAAFRDNAPASARSAKTFPGSNGKIAFMRSFFSSSSASGIYLVGSDGRGARRLAKQPLGSSGPKWSPDGREIAFFSAWPTPTYSLYTIKPDGSGKRKILSKTKDYAAVFPSWSPDGKSIVFTHGKTTSNGRTCIPFLCDSQLAILTLATGRVRELPHTSGATFVTSWSPDGKLIVFTRAKVEPMPNAFPSVKWLGLWLVTPNGLGHRRLTSGLDSYPDWSPDGQLIAFTRYRRNGNSDLLTVHPSGKHVSRLNTFTGELEQPSWSPDGSELVFVLTSGEWQELCTISSTGALLKCFAHPPKTDDKLPSWQPTSNP